MLQEGGTNDAVADAVKGISPEGVANLRRQQAAGVPAEKADANRKPSRPKSRDRGTVFVHAGPDLTAHWDAIAVKQGVSISDLIIATMVKKQHTRRTRLQSGRLKGRFEEMRICDECQCEYLALAPQARFCSTKCKERSRRRRLNNGE